MRNTASSRDVSERSIDIRQVFGRYRLIVHFRLRQGEEERIIRQACEQSAGQLLN
jgi:hypothetical protein